MQLSLISFPKQLIAMASTLASQWFCNHIAAQTHQGSRLGLEKQMFLFIVANISRGKLKV
jgi:hypothetical protein